MSEQTVVEGQLRIGAAWTAGAGRPWVSVAPGDGQSLWRGAAASPAQVDAAVQAARAALPAWCARPFAEREAITRAFAKLLERDRENLARVIALETGKPLWETRTEVTTMIGKVDLSVRAYHQRTGTTATPSGSMTAVLRHKPHGVVAVFGPYNFPGHLPNGHIVPALLAGNTVLFKPSELTPWVAEETVKLWIEAGLPEGVLNLLQGERETGAALAAHAGLDGLYFTGSARTGHILARQFAETPHKILALEMGGNNALIVSPTVVAADADLDRRAVLHDLLQSGYLSSGQRCTCSRRLFIPAGEAGDVLVGQFVAAIQAIHIGAPLAEPQPFMGPVISARAAQDLLAAQQRLLDLGATALVAMQPLALGEAYVSPALLDVTTVASLPDDEYFGPLVQLIRYQTLDEAIAKANATQYGLSASLISTSRDEYEYFWQHIRAGVVNWNRPTNGASGAAPFGGVGASGNHRPSAFYAADYCAYPVASVEAPACELPASLPPGLTI